MALKVLAWGNSVHETSGYGKQARALCQMWQDMGHQVAVAANSGIVSSSIEWKGIPIYPVRAKTLGLDVLPSYIAHYQPDILFTLYDIWVLPDGFRHQIPVPWVCYTPVDGTPVTQKMVNVLESCEWPVAFSQFGKAELGKVGIDAHYIPLGIDCDVFKPAPSGGRKAKESLGFDPDVWLVGMVAANKGFPCRKSWHEALQGFKLFHDQHPATALYLHTTNEPYGSAIDGVFFDKLLPRVGLDRSCVYMVDQGELAVGISDGSMANLYNAFDCLLSPSMGEGFGLPILEAQACGTPVVTLNCSSMPEITWNGIATEPIQPFYVAPLDYYWQIASPARIANALDKIHSGARDGSHIGIAHARAYDWRNLKEHWSAFWAKVEAEKW